MTYSILGKILSFQYIKYYRSTTVMELPSVLQMFYCQDPALNTLISPWYKRVSSPASFSLLMSHNYRGLKVSLKGTGRGTEISSIRN